jgi:hypothetical protein
MSQSFKGIQPTKTKVYKGSQGFQNSLMALPIPIDGNITIFGRSEIINNTKVAFLVFTPMDKLGNPDLDNTVSLVLPCPPYCTRGSGNISLIAETENIQGGGGQL